MKRKLLVCITIIAMILSIGAAYAIENTQDKPFPIAENLEIETYKNVSCEGTLRAISPEGTNLSYKITTKPSKGEVVLNEDGSFVYTPFENKRGKDYFGYQVQDSLGNCSNEATVIISIRKKRPETCYKDLKGNGCEYAASVLAEENIFKGECIGNQYVFKPEAHVTRGDFLRMCMELSDYDILSGVITTGFYDDEDISKDLKPYVSTALLTGVIHGYSGDKDTAVFEPNNYISYAEAAVILNKTLDLTDVNTESAVSSLNSAVSVPAWAKQACSNLSACRISDYNDSLDLTRKECAELLLGAKNILDKRK